MSLKRRIERLEADTRNMSDPRRLFDFVLDYKDGQPPLVIKVSQQFLDTVEKVYGPEAQARRAQLENNPPR